MTAPHPRLETRPPLGHPRGGASATTSRFCLIGERINPTGRRIFQEQLRAGDLSAIERDVKAQVEGGADVLDVNMGVPLTDEAELLAKAITMVQELTDLPICIDSSVVEALEAGLVGLPGPGAGQLDHRRGRPDGADPPAGQEVRRRDHRAAQRRTTRSRWRPTSGST